MVGIFPRNAGNKALLCHTADIKAVVLVVVVLRVGIGSIVVEVVRVRGIGISSRRPVVAVGTIIRQATIIVVAGTSEVRGELIRHTLVCVSSYYTS